MYVFRGCDLSYLTLLLLLLLLLLLHRVRVLGLDNLRNCSPEYDVVYVEVGVFHGGEELCTTLSTHEISSGMYPRWNQWLVFDIPVKNVPKVRNGLVVELRVHVHWFSG